MYGNAARSFLGWFILVVHFEKSLLGGRKPAGEKRPRVAVARTPYAELDNIHAEPKRTDNANSVGASAPRGNNLDRLAQLKAGGVQFGAGADERVNLVVHFVYGFWLLALLCHQRTTAMSLGQALPHYNGTPVCNGLAVRLNLSFVWFMRSLGAGLLSPSLCPWTLSYHRGHQGTSPAH